MTTHKGDEKQGNGRFYAVLAATTLVVLALIDMIARLAS